MTQDSGVHFRKERFQSIIDSTVDGMVTIDAKGTVEVFNRACETIFGYKSEEVIGKNVSLLMPEPYSSEHDQYLDNYKRGEKNNVVGVGREVEAKRKDGSLFPIYVSVCEVEIDGRIIFSGVLRDITEARKKEEQILRTNKKLEAIIDTIPDMLFIKDAKDLTFKSFNKTGEVIVGHRKENLLGKTAEKIFSKENADFFNSGDKEILKAKDVVFIEEKAFQTKNLGIRVFKTRKTVIKDDTGNPILILGVSEDITNLKEKEENLIRSNQELEQFAFIASHDLKAPLRHIKNNVEVLNEEIPAEHLNEDVKMSMDIINSSVIKMKNLIDDLLSYSTVNKSEVDFETSNLNELLTETLAIFTNQIKDCNAQLVTPELPTISCNANLMLKLFQNLIGNAIKYRNQQAPLQIKMTSEESKDFWKFSVMDNGIGIPSDKLSYVFEIFKRLHKSQEYKGTGIGLAICKKIVEQHKGEIWVESEQGKGSNFIFTISKHLR